MYQWINRLIQIIQTGLQRELEHLNMIRTIKNYLLKITYVLYFSFCNDNELILSDMAIQAYKDLSSIVC